jgi:hypothetical protein
MVTAQEIAYGACVDGMPQICQGPLDAPIAPRRVLFRHTYDKQLDLLCDAGSAKLTTWLAAVKRLGDQSLILAHEGIGRHESCHLFEALAAEWVGKRCEATAFRVRQAQPAATEPGFEDAIFLKEIRDDLLLVLLEPSSDHGDQDLENHSRSSVWRS